MNREETKEAIKVMQAYAEGKEIEYRTGNVWCLCRNPSWSFGDIYYRIKPEPKVIWVNEYEDGTGSAYTSRDQAVNESENFSEQPERTAVKYVEVMDE